MPKNYVLAWIYVVIQFACIALILLTGPLWVENRILMITGVFGIILALWAIIAMGLPGLSVMPLVKPDAVLTFRGPYRFIRHPMYLSLLIVMGVLVGSSFTPMRLVIMIMLTINLLAKMSFEEKQLIRHFPSYSDYVKRTYKIIPFLL